MIDAQYVLLQAEQVIYADLQAQKAALITGSNADASSIANAGEGGSESYSAATITQQMTDSAMRMRELMDELKRLMELGNLRFPWVSTPCRRPNYGYGYYW